MTEGMRKRGSYVRREAMRLRQRALIAEVVARRLDLGLTQREIGDDTGMHQSGVSDMESILNLSEERTVTLDSFMAYAAAVGLKLNLEVA